jgi:aminodeoxyfutalosine synthase
MADQVRQRRHGRRATFVFNRQINPTNICVLSCKFCDYATKEGKPNAYVLSEKDILDRLSPDLREVHIVGGLYSKWSFDDYLNVLRVIRKAYPHIQLKAYTAVEIDYFARKEKMPFGQFSNGFKTKGWFVCRGVGRKFSVSGFAKPCSPLKSGGRNGRKSIARPTNWGFGPTPPCCTAISKPSTSGWTT